MKSLISLALRYIPRKYLQLFSHWVARFLYVFYLGNKVYCNHVMEHVSDDLQAMREIYRVLKPGGWGIIQVPLFYPLPEITYEDNSIVKLAEREEAFGQDDHVRLYGKDYLSRLQSAGFEAQEIWPGKKLPDAEVKRYALPLDEPIFFVRKPTIG